MRNEFFSPIAKDDVDLECLEMSQEKPQKVEDLICFALYSTTSAINKAYAPHLARIGLTYPQYITLSALWQELYVADATSAGMEENGVTVGWLCDKLMTDTNTMTPILKRLEASGHIKRQKGTADKRQVFISLTVKGGRLKTEQVGITKCVVADTGLPEAELEALVRSINKMRDNLSTD
jgi:DNA-binding MarR family transcriptional regulator